MTLKNNTNKKLKITFINTFVAVVLISSIAVISYPQFAHATTFNLADQASCEAAPFSGTWDGGETSCTVSNLVINAGDILHIDSSVNLFITGTFDNFGTVEKNALSEIGRIFNQGTINNEGNFEISFLEVTGTFNNLNTFLIDDQLMIDTGVFNNSGTMTNTNGCGVEFSDDAVLNNSGVLNNIDSASILLEDSSTINNSGTINISSDSLFDTNAGTLNNTGTINNAGEINNTGILNNFSLINNAGGTITNVSIGTIDNQGVICGGTLNDSGTFTGNPVEVTCSLGTLKITKLTTGGDDSFNFTATGTTGFDTTIVTSSGTGMNGPRNVAAGTYSVQEINIPAGWTLTTASCDDGSSAFSVDTVSGIVIGQSDTIECTFENQMGAPNPDTDSDGIFNEVDLLPSTFSDDFDDTPIGGTSDGSIITRGDQILTISEEANPDGVRVKADISGGVTPATVEFCSGMASIDFNPGDESVETCSSVTVTVINGQPVITFFATDDTEATTTLTQGNSITFDQDTFSFTAPATNTETVIISVNGVDNPIDPGSSVSVPLQTANPDSDPTLRWVNGIGEDPCTDLNTFNCVDETFRDDSDYIQTIGLGKKNSDKQFYTLSDISDPLTSDGHVLRYTVTEADVGVNPVKLDVILRQGETVIASFHHENLPTGFTLIEQTLTAAQADSITDYSDLELTLDGNCDNTCKNSPGNREKIQVSWIEFAIMATS